MRITVLLLIILSSLLQSQMRMSVYFVKSSDHLQSKEKLKLDSLLSLKGQYLLRVFGNCDPSGNLDFNERLSKNRAESVKDYLEQNKSQNFTIVLSEGLGDQKQINDNSTEELRNLNRRVDVFIERKLQKGERVQRKSYPSFFSKEVSKMGVRDTFSLPDVNFYGGRHIWLPKGKLQMERLAKILLENSTLEVELQGHICCDYENFDGQDLDTKTYNLSFTRAHAIKEFLVVKGISPNRIKSIGLGHLNPLVYPEIEEKDFEKNRRVEIVIINK